MAVNCYTVALDRDGSPYFLARDIHGDVISGFIWNGHSYEDSAEISITDLNNGFFNVTHFYGLTEIIYESIYDATWHYVTRFIYIKIRLRRHIDSTYQHFFNKRKLVTKKRMDLLRLMMDDQLDRRHDGVTSIDLISRIYSMRLFLHPSWELQHKKIKIYLESLVSSGELQKINDEYVVTGKAISTIEQYEEDERRHTEAVKIQRRILYLTIVAVMVAAVQSGLIKLPTLIDLSSPSDAISHRDD